MAKPRKLEVTDEMRQAVYAELCETDGHALSLQQAFVFDVDHQNQTVGSPDETKMPNIYCTRCKRTWLVLIEPGTSYEDAEEKLRGKLKDTKDIDELRKKRKPTA